MKNRLIRDIQRLSREEGAYVTDVTISNYEASELLPMIEATDRAWWWREVTDAEEVIPKGCPVRLESREDAREHRATHGWSRAEFSAAARVFIDSRWEHAYKVGDVITECTPDNLPADGVAIVDIVGDVGQLEGTRLGWACGGGVTWGSSVGEWCLPMTVIYVPTKDEA